MIIRHAEKPNKLAGVSGVSAIGVPDRDELAVKGWQRAGALVRFFNPRPLQGFAPGIVTPDAIFATNPDDENPSKRPLRTVEPLASDLGLNIRLDFAVHQERDLVAAVFIAAPVVLISWHHERVQKIAAALGVDQIEDWPDDVFDQVVVFDRGDAGWTDRVVLQSVLPGDRKPSR